MREEFLSDILTLMAVFTLSLSNGERSLNTRELVCNSHGSGSGGGPSNSHNGPDYQESSHGDDTAQLLSCQVDENEVDCSSHTSSKGKLTFQQCQPISDFAVTVISRMMALLGWNTLVVICDTQNEQRALDVAQAFDTDLRTWTLLVAQINGILDVYRELLYLRYLTQFQVQYLNVLVICSGENLRYAIEQAGVFQAETERRQEIGYVSKWLFVSTAGKGQRDIIRFGLDNIALIELLDVCDCHQHTLEVDCCSPTPVRTLMYGAERSRYWDVVGNVMTSGEVELSAAPFPNTQHGLNMRQLVIGTNEWPPFVIRSAETETPRYTGFCVEMLHHMAVKTNFSYVFEEPSDGEWGRNANEEWTGLVGQAQRREVDLAMAPLTTSVDRGRVVDFAYPFYYGYAGGVFKSPALKRKAMKTLLEPFQYPVFLCLAIVFVVLSIQLYLGEKYGGSTSQNYSSSPLWADTIMFVFGTFVRCVTECTVVSRSGRVLVISLWIFTIIIAAAYSGNLMAILTLARDNAPFNTIADVTKQTEYTWGVSGGTIWYSKFETEPDFKNVWEGIKEFNRTDPRVTSFDQTAHCDKVHEGSYVYFTELDMASVCAGNSCGIRAITETFYRISYACAFPKGSPFAQIFSRATMDMENFGLLGFWKEKWWPKQPYCDNKATSHDGIELEDVQTAFYLLAGGIVSAAAALVIEKLLKYYKMIKQQTFDMEEGRPCPLER